MKITKVCTKCHRRLPVSSFYVYRSNSTLRGRCKACHKEQGAKLREANRSRYNARARDWNLRNKATLKEMNRRNYQAQNAKRTALVEAVLDENPCRICGETDHDVLTFHHLDPKKKEHGVTSHSATWRKVWKEIQKCVVLCHNHHVKLHRGNIALPHTRPLKLDKARLVIKSFPKGYTNNKHEDPV